MRLPVWFLGLLLAGCGSGSTLKLTSSADVGDHVHDARGGQSAGDLETSRFRPELCGDVSLEPDYAQLNEAHLIAFLAQQRIPVRVERPRADLVYLVLTGVGTEQPVRLRVAVLKTADEAGRELHEAILQHGTGSWGVRRSNLAVLGPVGDPEDDIAFAARTKLACWGVFTVAGLDDAFVIPGAYAEL
jgi:hypothetical protein